MALRLLFLAAGQAVLGKEDIEPSCAAAGASYVDPSVPQENGGTPEDATACQELCGKTPGCAVFTFYSDSKGCWLMTTQAHVRSPALPSDHFAVSGPKECPEKKETTTTTTPTTSQEAKTAATDLDMNDEGLVTVAPGIEISPTGIRPVGLGASPDEAQLGRSPDEVTAFGYTVAINGTAWGLPEKVFGVREVAGYSWVWWALGAIVLLLAACICSWCCRCCSSSKRPRKSRAVRAEATVGAPEALSREPTEAQEQVPLVVKDAGLTQPRLSIPQLPMPQLQMPQLVPVPASQANARSFELAALSPGGHWSPGQGQFVRMPMSPSRYP